MSQLVFYSAQFLYVVLAISTLKIKTMADHVSRKHMGKHFRLSSEVRATLQRKHDRWTPYQAYSRVEKGVGAFRAICQIILSFFKMPPKTEEGEVGCNGRAVKMFSDLIKRSFRDDDFVSRKCTTFNVVRFFSLSYYSLSFNGTICK